MREFDVEYEFCKECSHHGEPNGCNREGGECEAFQIFVNAYNELQDYKNTGLMPEEITKAIFSGVPEWIPQYLSYRKLGTIEELAHYRQLEADGRLIEFPDMPQDIDNPLEPLKIKSALDSEIMKFNYRKEHKLKDISILDYTIIVALQECLTEAMKKPNKQ